jgi:hypothetical protein
MGVCKKKAAGDEPTAKHKDDNRTTRPRTIELSIPNISDSESRLQAVDDFLSRFPSAEAEAAAEEVRLEEIAELAGRAINIWLAAMHLRQIILITKVACLTIAEAAL